MDREQLQASAAWRYATALRRERLTQALHRRRAGAAASMRPADGRPAGPVPGTTLPRGR